METLALDSSALLTWILQERGWRAVDEILQADGFQLVMPGPVLTECIYRARSKGNASTPDEIAEALEAQGLAVEVAGRDDLVAAAGYHEMSHAHPYIDERSATTSSLSLADSLILAVCKRLGCRVVTRDRYWKWLESKGYLDVTVVPF